MLSTAGAAFRQLCRLERYRSAAVDCQTDGGLLLTARIFHPIVGWADFGALFPFSRHRSSGRSNNDQQPSKAKLASLRRPGASTSLSSGSSQASQLPLLLQQLQQQPALPDVATAVCWLPCDHLLFYSGRRLPLTAAAVVTAANFCRLRLMIGTLQC